MNKNNAQKIILRCYNFYLDRQIFLQNFKKNFYRCKFYLKSHALHLYKPKYKYDECGHTFNMMIYYLDKDGDILVPTPTYYNLVNDHNIENLPNRYLAIALILYKLKNNKNFQYYKSDKIFNLLYNNDNLVCNEIWNNYFSI